MTHFRARPGFDEDDNSGDLYTKKNQDDPGLYLVLNFVKLCLERDNQMLFNTVYINKNLNITGQINLILTKDYKLVFKHTICYMSILTKITS